MDCAIKEKKNKRIDMLQGSLLDKLLLFAIPLAASSILQQLFNSVDVAVVGRFASSQAQAAVGCNGSVINLILNLFVGISVGANVVIARYIGENKKGRIKNAVHTSMLVAIVSGVFLLIVGILISRNILEWMNTPEDVIEHAVLYLRIYFLGVPFIMVYNFGSAILRSVGDTKRPLYCLALAGVINAVLNMILVIVFHFGVAGVGIATVVSNIISSSIVVYLLVHEQGLIKLNLKELRVSMHELKAILRMGVPAGLQSVVFSIANVFIQTSLNGYGSDAVAGSAVALNYECCSYFIVSAFAQTAVTFTSQNFGAKKYDRCKKIFMYSIIMSIVISWGISLSIIFGRSFFISLFTSEAEVGRYASIRMIHLMGCYFLVSLYEVAGGALRGMGYSMTPTLITIFGTCVLRLIWIATVCKWYTGFETLMNVYPVSWMITGAVVMVCYFIIRKKGFSEAA